MESQPQNPEFRINPENFHPCRQWEILVLLAYAHRSSHCINMHTQPASVSKFWSKPLSTPILYVSE